jgi:hypothetical protein
MGVEMRKICQLEQNPRRSTSGRGKWRLPRRRACWSALAFIHISLD